MSDGSSPDLNQSGTFRRDGAILNGQYVIERLIKAGGMGQVYRGRRLADDAVVAIKIIKPEFLSNPTALSFFVREAEALRELTRGGGIDAIIEFHAFDEEEGTRRRFLVMEYVDGPSLSERMRAGPLNYEEVLTLCRRVAGGLQVAHTKGIIHRDLSPDNILLSHNDLASAKIIDLGVARMRDSDTTTFLGFAGKNNFASPEQVGLFGGKAFEKSDTYSLGLVLAAAARGEALEMAGNLADVVRKRQSVPDLSAFDARLRPLLEKMLEPDPATRWSMGDVIAWCDRQTQEKVQPPEAAEQPTVLAADRGPPRKPPPGGPVPSGPGGERKGRNRLPLVAGVGVLALLAGVGGGFWFIISQDTIQPVGPVAQGPSITTTIQGPTAVTAAVVPAPEPAPPVVAPPVTPAPVISTQVTPAPAAPAPVTPTQVAPAPVAPGLTTTAPPTPPAPWLPDPPPNVAQQRPPVAPTATPPLPETPPPPVIETTPAQPPAVAPTTAERPSVAPPDAVPPIGPLASLPPSTSPLEPPPPPVFDPKDPEVVRRAQLSLKALGCYFGATDGIDGRQTQAALANAARLLRFASTTMSPDLLAALDNEAMRTPMRRLCPPPAPVNPTPVPQAPAPQATVTPAPAPAVLAPVVVPPTAPQERRRPNILP